MDFKGEGDNEDETGRALQKDRFLQEQSINMLSPAEIEIILNDQVQLAALAQAEFAMADVDQSNFIEHTELMQCMSQIGYDNDQIDTQLGTIMMTIDIDYNIKIDSQEFDALLRMILTNMLDL